MAKQAEKKIVKEQPGKDGWTKSEEMVLKNSNHMYDIFITILKKIEISEFQASEVYNLHHPDCKEDNPWERIITLCNKFVKHLNAKYVSYLKANKLKIPKTTQNNTKSCVVEPLKQVKTIK